MDINVRHRASFITCDSHRNDNGWAYNHGGWNDQRICSARFELHGHNARPVTGSESEVDTTDSPRPQRVWRRHSDLRHRRAVLRMVRHTFTKFVASIMFIRD